MPDPAELCFYFWSKMEFFRQKKIMTNSVIQIDRQKLDRHTDRVD